MSEPLATIVSTPLSKNVPIVPKYLPTAFGFPLKPPPEASDVFKKGKHSIDILNNLTLLLYFFNFFSFNNAGLFSSSSSVAQASHTQPLPATFGSQRQPAAIVCFKGCAS